MRICGHVDMHVYIHVFGSGHVECVCDNVDMCSHVSIHVSSVHRRVHVCEISMCAWASRLRSVHAEDGLSSAHQQPGTNSNNYW